MFFKQVEESAVYMCAQSDSEVEEGGEDLDCSGSCWGWCWWEAKDSAHRSEEYFTTFVTSASVSITVATSEFSSLTDKGTAKV